jgi:APA family basic amino acid/polyamine antiporter
MAGSGKLKRSLSWLYVYALATGAILTFMGYWDGMFLSAAGPSTFLAFAVLALLMLPVGFVYCEFATLLPSCGVELVYGTVGLNKHVGYWSTWLILAAWLAVPPAGVMGIISWINYIAGLQLSIAQIAVISAAFITVYLLLSLYEISLAGQIQTIMLFFALAVLAVTAFMYIFSPAWSLSHFTPFFSSLGYQKDWGSFAIVIGWALLITPYFGFETVPNLVEEGNFPIKDQSKAIIGSILTCAGIYALFFFALSGMGDNATLTKGGTFPAFISSDVLKGAFGYGPLMKVWLVLFGIGAIIFTIGTCILGFWISSVRMFYAMGRQNFLPKVFARTNRHAQPIVPNLLIWALSILALIVMNVSSFLQEFFCLMSFCCAAAYSLISLSSIVLAVRNKSWVRPYRIPGGMAMRVAAFVISTVIAVLCTFGQPGWTQWFVYMGFGVLVWLYQIIFKWRREKVWMETPDGVREY